MIFTPIPVIWKLWGLRNSGGLDLEDMSWFEKALLGTIVLVLLVALFVSGSALVYIVYTDTTDPYASWEAKDIAFRDSCKKRYLRSVVNSHEGIRISHIRRANELCSEQQPNYQPTSKTLKAAK